jgi:drug/metabolite transporter (DMT)-like permease
LSGVIEMFLRKEFRVMTVFNRIFGLLALVATVVGVADLALAGSVRLGPVGAPGPIAGVGLPILAAVVLGAYWLVKRYRDKTN